MHICKKGRISFVRIKKTGVGGGPAKEKREKDPCLPGKGKKDPICSSIPVKKREQAPENPRGKVPAKKKKKRGEKLHLLFDSFSCDARRVKCSGGNSVEKNLGGKASLHQGKRGGEVKKPFDANRRKKTVSRRLEKKEKTPGFAPRSNPPSARQRRGDPAAEMTEKNSLGRGEGGGGKGPSFW